MRTIRVTGIVSTGGYEDDHILLPLAEMESLSGLSGRLTEAQLALSTAELAQGVTRLRSLLPGSRIREVRQVAHTSKALLDKVRLLLILATAVVLVASAASITGTMSTTVLERQAEIGLMKAMGGTRRNILAIFAAEAFVLGIVGGVSGYILGLVIAQGITISVFGVTTGLYPLLVPAAVGTALLLSIAGGVGPMTTVVRLDPVQALRGE
jgi:putative ABC transport system permease protein